MNNRDRQVLNKILQEIDIAVDMVSGVSEGSFLGDEKLRRAVCMTLINIGELVKNLTRELVEQYKEIPWREVAGFRDIAAHKYQTLRMEDVYLTVTNDLPALGDLIKKI